MMEKKRLSIYLAPAWYKKVVALAESMDNSVSGTIAWLIRVGYNQVERGGLPYVKNIVE